MAYTIMNPELGFPLIGATGTNRDTSARIAVGTVVRAVDPTYGSGEFIYLKGVASCALYDWVTYNMDDGSTTRLAADAIGPVGVAMATLTASYYGWFQISGKALANCLTLFADNAAVFCTGTAGKVDDTSVAGDLVENAKGASAKAVGTAYAEFEIARPWVNNRAANK